jgi:hypothetical protein
MTTATMVRQAGLGGLAKSSDDYVSDILARRQGKKVAHSDKIRVISRILSDETSGFKRLGVGMIGPIQLKLRYQGITRNVLVEDPVTPGTPVQYDVWDDLGQSYVMSGHEGEVRIQIFEGKRVDISFFRIASHAQIRKEDLLYLRINAVEQAQDETKQSILKQEDARLMIVLQSALTTYATRPDHTVTPNHTVTETSGYFTPASMYTAVAQTDMHELSASRMLVNPIDYRDFFRWDINTTGWAFKDRVVAGETITTFGEFAFQRSIQVPQKTMYLLPEPNFLGVFPVLYSLDVEENHQVDRFLRGWVFDEMISMAILNPRGIAAVVKS